ADQDISSESVDENPLYVYGMMRKNRKWFSGIRGCFLFQMLLLTDVFFAAVYSCWKCWTNSSGNDAIEKALLSLHILMIVGYVEFLKHSVRIHARSYMYIENKKRNLDAIQFYLLQIREVNRYQNNFSRRGRRAKRCI
ncbi:hypothetical protein, partial [Blautia massiliensis (ex Durand et al. 2017)]|uniref:hypothetical protein n=1 Tax=Blautia massiliensis (ex Durand et al. 2017) TaxID=1737424 RepID=UPI001A9ACE23